MNIDEEALQKRMREVMAERPIRVPEPPLYLREIDEKVYEDLRRDAERFRFLRWEYMQGLPQTGPEPVSDRDAEYFNKVIDSRMAKRGVTNA